MTGRHQATEHVWVPHETECSCTAYPVHGTPDSFWGELRKFGEFGWLPTVYIKAGVEFGNSYSLRHERAGLGKPEPSRL